MKKIAHRSARASTQSLHHLGRDIGYCKARFLKGKCSRTCMVEVEQFQGGFDENFSYLVWDKQTKEGAVFDTSVNPTNHFTFAEEHGIRIVFAFVMHSHMDHLVGLDSYRKKAIPLYGHEDLDAEVDVRVKHGDIIQVGETEFTVLHAPGHRFDCVLLHGDKKVFTTDVVFVGGCGRCDLQGSDPEAMYHTLYERFMQLPDETRVYPGHNYGDTETSTVLREKKENPYLLCKSKEEFLQTRM